MLDIGWGELLVIGVVALVVVGPKDLPGLFRTAGNFMGRARGMAREFQRSMEAAADESGLKDASSHLRIDRLNLGSATGSARKYAETLVKGIDDVADPKPAAKPARKPAPKPVVAGAPAVESAPPPASSPPAEADAAPRAPDPAAP